MTFSKSNLYFWSCIFRDVLLFGFFLLSFQQVILKNSVLFSNLFSEQCHFCLSAQASSQSDKCSCWTIYVTFLCAAFLSPLGWVLSFYSYAMVFGPGLCLSSPAGGGCCIVLLLWIFLFCLREFFYSNKQAAFSDKERVLFLLLIPILSSQSAIWSLRVEILLFIYIFLIVLMQLAVLSICLIQWKLWGLSTVGM